MRTEDMMANKLEKDVIGNIPALVIQRIPYSTLQGFKDFSFKEFSGDYGMALKCIWDYYVGENRSQRMNQLEGRIEQLEMTLGEFISNQDDKKDEEKGEIMLDGSTRKE